MTNIFEFMIESPWLSFFIIITISLAAVKVICFAINRPLRHLNIYKHGYPPIHYDADGDFKKDDE